MTTPSSDSPRIAVVIGSTRPSRICPVIAGEVQARWNALGATRYELLDLADVGLPLLDEPIMASRGEYLHDHTRRWSETVKGFDGFVFVFPQYNWGYPAVLKNALDYLYVEWRDKPATTVTYGTRGGGKGADQLTQVLHGLHLQVLDARVEIPIGATDVDADGQLVDVAATLELVAAQIDAVAAAFAGAFAGALA